MIIDQINNLDLYKNLIPEIEEIKDFITNSKLLKEGKYECGKGIALIQEGITYPIEEGVFEVHKKYIDVITLISGKEILEWAPRQTLLVSLEYDNIKDVSFMKGHGNSINILAGMFYILFTDDAHKACCHISGPTQYRKIVVKLPIS